jgi:hypothetical protein
MGLELFVEPEATERWTCTHDFPSYRAEFEVVFKSNRESLTSESSTREGNRWHSISITETDLPGMSVTRIPRGYPVYASRKWLIKELTDRCPSYYYLPTLVQVNKEWGYVILDDGSKHVHTMIHRESLDS